MTRQPAHSPGSTSNAQRTRGRRHLLIVAAIFLGPFIAAVLLHSLGWQPGGYVNRGQLLSPPIALPALEASTIGGHAPVSGRWTVLVVNSVERCADACVRALDDTRRVLDLLGHDRDRMQLALVALKRLDADALAAQSDLIGVDASGASDPASGGPFADARDGTVFVADPAHNLILRYEAGADPRGLLEDLKRLLKYSGQ